MLRVRFGIRGRVLAIALVPSFALLSAGAGMCIYLLEEGIHTKAWIRHVDQSTSRGVVFTGGMQQERQMSLLQVAGDSQVPADLAAVRQQVDYEITVGSSALSSLAPLDPSLTPKLVAVGTPLYTRMPDLRHQVDTGTASPTDTFAVWTGLISLAVESMDLIARTAPDAATSVEESKARSVFDAGEALSRAVALSVPAMIGGSTPPAQLPPIVTEVGAFRTAVDELGGRLAGDQLAALRAMTASPAWQRLNTAEDAIERGGVVPPDTSGGDAEDASWKPDVAQWQSDSALLGKQMLDLYHSQQDRALAVAGDSANRIARNSMVGGIAVLAISIAAFAVALSLSSRLIRRLDRLRGDTLALADRQLPDLMEQLREGRGVDPNVMVPRLDYGSDEIGEVGDAFNRAQLAAVTAAVTEAKTRAGVRAVFLNIAHRSQAVVHRQLEILDRAEYETDDPRQLQMLFELDHLVTRERRNAENLIILGGGQPGRRWRAPVLLTEIVRSAIGETEDYARVRATRLPKLNIAGFVVADLIHLLAELIDNATSFSPPETRVEVSGSIVDRGVAVEIADQGLGMIEDEVAKFNETLGNPPDFSVDTLSSDSRLGLFVVAQLAVRNEISVRLAESVYGGVRAIVLIPSALIAPETAELGTSSDSDDEWRLNRPAHSRKELS
jgi:signal transduction histidine kinase